MNVLAAVCICGMYIPVLALAPYYTTCCYEQSSDFPRAECHQRITTVGQPAVGTSRLVPYTASCSCTVDCVDFPCMLVNAHCLVACEVLYRVIFVQCSQ
jgi:hypothetical protein